MNSVQALQHEFIVLPKSYDNSISFLQFIRTSLKNYLWVVSQIDEGSIVSELKDARNEINYLCESLIQSYEQLYLGFISKSYNHFDAGARAIESYLLKPTTAHPIGQSKLLFRARISDEPIRKNQIFHLPFELRHLASTQRFSIPGLPSLYLADSAYVCWEELNRPAHSRLYLSRFEVTDFIKLRTLDISLTPQFLTKMINVATEHVGTIDDWDPMVLEFLIKWPIIFCCSIKVLYDKGAFKPEYIIPQYLVEWVRTNGRFNSIKYFSVKSHLWQIDDYSSFVNIVFPVQEIRDIGHCDHLSKSFAYTEPHSLSQTTNSEFKKADLENYIMNYRRDKSILLTSLNAIGENYLKSIYGKFEIESCLEKAK